MCRDRQSKNPKETAALPLPAGNVLVSRQRLIQRWQHGSDSFFWRAEAAGLLRPVRRRRSVLYLISDVFAFEGGQPPDGQDAEFRVDLMLPEEVGVIVSRGRDWVLDLARSGELPSRRVGSKFRFVPAEVARWQAARWT